MSDWGSLLNLEQVCFYEFCRYARLEVSFCEFLSGVVNTCCTHSYIYVYSYTNVLLFSCIYMQRIYDYLSIYLLSIYLCIYLYYCLQKYNFLYIYTYIVCICICYTHANIVIGISLWINLIANFNGLMVG